jgi:hypothetical protein
MLSNPIKQAPINVARIMFMPSCMKSKRQRQPAAAIKNTFTNVLGGTLNNTANPRAAIPNQKHFSISSIQFIIKSDK